MSKIIENLSKFFLLPEDEDGEDDFRLPLDESGKLIRPIGTVKAVPHKFRTRSSRNGQPQIDLHEILPLDDESLALLAIANAAREKAYARYSGFRVGAALVAKSGQVYLGVNIENASYPAGICAERSAISAAVTAGERDFTAIAICGGLASEPCFPCGICRQVLSEFCGPDFPVILSTGIYPLKNLLPHSFTL